MWEEGVKMGLVKTNDNCVGCNRCIRACPSRGANVAIEKERGNVIEVDPQKCIACGACIDACEHGAREYEDDVERFFADLKRGDRISVIIAPASIPNAAFFAPPIVTSPASDFPPLIMY